MTTTFKGSCNTGVGVGPTTIYTAGGATTTIVLALNITNITAGTITAGARYTDSSAAKTAYIGGKAFTLPAGAAELVITKENCIVLETGDSLSVDGNTAAAIDWVLAVMELT